MARRPLPVLPDLSLTSPGRTSGLPLPGYGVAGEGEVVATDRPPSGERLIGGIATHRTRAPQRRPKQRRQYRGTLRAGELACTPGAWVVCIAKDGTPTEPAWDGSLRLRVNLGDLVLVCGGDDVAVLRVTNVIEPGWNERWRVETVCGACRDGSVLAMSARGLQRARKPRKPRRSNLAAIVAERAAKVRRAA